MKTHVTLKSTDRELFGITIRQNTKEKFLNVNDLREAYKKARIQYGWSDNSVSYIMRSETLHDKIYYILFERKLTNVSLKTFKEMIDNDGAVNVLKTIGVWITTGRGENKTVMCDPYIWVLLAMELNPMIYAKVVMWLTDSLIFDRVDAGSEYMPMNSAIKGIIEEPNYPKFASAINERVFGSHMNGIRNLANAKELRKIADIEKFIINAIKSKWIKTEEEIVNAIKNYN